MPRGWRLRFTQALILGLTLAVHQYPSQAAATPFAIVESDIFVRVNMMRAQNGIGPVTPDPQLAEIAYRRSSDMVSRNYFSHTFPDCQPERDVRWSSALGIPCNVLGLLDSRRIAYAWAGEILEWNLFLTQFDQQQTDAMAMADFLRSPAHKSILLEPRFTNAGAGVAIGLDKKMIVTIIFTQNPG